MNEQNHNVKSVRSIRSRLSRRRKFVYALLAATVVPGALLLALEFALRGIGFGYPSDLFLKHASSNSYSGNPQFCWRFFPPSLAANPYPFRLTSDKRDGSYRVFVLGGSAALGDPEPPFGFWRVLNVMLRDVCPNAQIEVLPMAMTAINSHVVREIVEDCAKHQPDLFVIYMGNNEVTGPYGPETVFQGFAGSRALIRTMSRVRKTKLGQLAQLLTEPDELRWRGMEIMAGHHVRASDPRLSKTYEYFESNLVEICELARSSGAQVIVCTIASNLKVSPPFAFLHRADLIDQERAQWESFYEAGVRFETSGDCSLAIEQFLKAERIDDEFAELRFRIARCYEANLRFDKARRAYKRSRDLDALQFRADTRINEIIRKVAGRQENQEVHLVDVERRFETDPACPHGIPGNGLFHDHVHMKFRGNYLLAKWVFEELVPLLPNTLCNAAGRKKTSLHENECAVRLGLTDFNRYQMRNGMFSRFETPPFTDQLDHQQRMKRLRQALTEYEETQLADGKVQAEAAYRKAIAQWPDDWLLNRELAAMLVERSDFAGAIPHAVAFAKAMPHLDGPKVMSRQIIMGLLNEVPTQSEQEEETAAAARLQKALELAIASNETELAIEIQNRLERSQAAGSKRFLDPSSP